jgi:hypothetical protein
VTAASLTAVDARRLRLISKRRARSVADQRRARCVAPAADVAQEAAQGVACINSISCCGGFVLVDERAEQLASLDDRR